MKKWKNKIGGEFCEPAVGYKNVGIQKLKEFLEEDINDNPTANKTIIKAKYGLFSMFIIYCYAVVFLP